MMERRLKLAWVFRSKSQTQHDTPLVKKLEVAKCTELVDPAITAFSNEIKRTGHQEDLQTTAVYPVGQTLACGQPDDLPTE